MFGAAMGKGARVTFGPLVAMEGVARTVCRLGSTWTLPALQADEHIAGHRNVTKSKPLKRFRYHRRFIAIPLRGGLDSSFRYRYIRGTFSCNHLRLKGT